MFFWRSLGSYTQPVGFLQRIGLLTIVLSTPIYQVPDQGVFKAKAFSLISTFWWSLFFNISFRTTKDHSTLFARVFLKKKCSFSKQRQRPLLYHALPVLGPFFCMGKSKQHQPTPSFWGLFPMGKSKQPQLFSLGATSAPLGGHSAKQVLAWRSSCLG